MKQHVPASCPRLGIRSRVVDRSFVMHDLIIHAMPAFSNMELFGFRMAGRVNPTYVILPRDIDHQSVSLPVADALSVECRIPLVRRCVLPPVRVSAAADVEGL